MERINIMDANINDAVEAASVSNVVEANLGIFNVRLNPNGNTINCTLCKKEFEPSVNCYKTDGGGIRARCPICKRNSFGHIIIGN